MALVGRLRYAEHRSIPEIHRELTRRGIVVARVSMSPLFITQLIDALQKNWSGYAQKAMPRDLLGGGATDQTPKDS